MPWEVCIVGRVSAAKRVLNQRFAEATRGELGPHAEKAQKLAQEIVREQLAAAEKLGGDKYITITAAGEEDKQGYTEIKMAIRMLPGFVTE